MGLALARASEILGAEPFFHELIAGIERVLTPHGFAFLLKVVPDPEAAAAAIERWAADGLVEGVVLIDLLPDDPRVSLVRRLGLPAVVIGDPGTGSGLPTVWAEDDLAMRDAVEVLADLGHEHIGHITGPRSLAHTAIRSEAFLAVAAERGIRVREADGDYSEQSGELATTALLAGDDAPTAIIADNDLMALGAIAAARRAGVEVPEQLAILAWDDSALAQRSEPPLAAMSHDVQRIGELTGESILAALAAAEPAVVTAPRARFVRRGSIELLRNEKIN
ncbi:LacI family transcriptional regulator [Protaetiibacter larvae]|uniref:LacI family transcriptional regulator n=1 Tax=Protaetiibacter larvae TaxID=2592654 RepID=A0A5C1YCV3_9MICO|nr:LacI family transcriptional regulator [Protaetiibacter larvae]